MLSGVVVGYTITGGDYRGAIVGGIAGIIPDLDEPKSKFGKVLIPISYPLHSVFGHRTFTHSLLFILLMGSLTFLLFSQWVSLAVMGGLFAHILGDMLTGTVKFLYPSKIPVGIRINPLFFTFVDRIARYALIVVIVILGWNEINQYLME